MSFFSKQKTKKINRKPDASVDKDKMSDIVLEQTETPQTTTRCPDSIKDDQLSIVHKNPESYLEINMLTTTRVVDNFYIPFNKKSFKYRETKYNIDEKKIYLLPTKSGFFMLTSFYKENNIEPKSFTKSNKGITSKALTLLYDEKLYTYLLAVDEKKYNFFIAVFSVILLITFAVGVYVVFR